MVTGRAPEPDEATRQQIAEAVRLYRAQTRAVVRAAQRDAHAGAALARLRVPGLVAVLETERQLLLALVGADDESAVRRALRETRATIRAVLDGSWFGPLPSPTLTAARRRRREHRAPSPAPTSPEGAHRP